MHKPDFSSLAGTEVGLPGLFSQFPLLETQPVAFVPQESALPLGDVLAHF